MNQNDRRFRYGSDVMADMLRILGIQYAAINPGSSYRGLHDSIVNYLGNQKPEVILCPHEGIAVGMAHGYGKMAGKPMAAMVHNVVGLLHGTLAIYNAWLDEAAVLVVGATGPMDTEQRRPKKDWEHTALVQGNVVRDYVKWDDQPATLAGVPDAFMRAWQVATTDPKGPVYLCLDTRLQEAPVDAEPPMPLMPRHPVPSPPQADRKTIEKAGRLLVAAERPVVIADYTGRNPEAVAGLVELAELMALPVIDAGGRFNFPNTHPLDLTGAEDELLRNADVVLALDVHNPYKYLTSTARDTRLSRYRIGEKCLFIHIAVQHLPSKSWSQTYGKLVPVDLPITADTALALPRLGEVCRGMLTEDRQTKLSQRYEQLKRKHAAMREKWREQASGERNHSPIALSRLAQAVWDVIRNEDWALVSKDIAGWARRLWDWDQPYQFAGGPGLGCRLAHALGAALAHRSKERLCVNFQPDGDLLYTPAALWTAAHHRIPLLMIMNNNRSYYNSERHQEMVAETRKRPVERKGIGTHIQNPAVDYAGLARDFGLQGFGPVENPDDLPAVLEEAVKILKTRKEAVLVDVVTHPTR